MTYVFIIAAILAMFAFLYYQNNRIDITNYEMNIPLVTKETRFVHLSDLHSKPSKDILEKVTQIRPGIICITGDYINDKCRRKKQMLAYAHELTKIAPVVYIPGNHENRLSNFDDLMKELHEAGFHVLLNEIYHINEFVFLGLNEKQADFKDYSARKKGAFVYPDMSGHFDKLQNGNGIRILLSHFPENYKLVSEMNYSQYDFDLQLSGHAHGGQWILPFVGPVFSPGQGLFPKYARGEHGDHPKLIVSRGIGNAEFPFRLFNHPEINVITFKN